MLCLPVETFSELIHALTTELNKHRSWSKLFVVFGTLKCYYANAAQYILISSKESCDFKFAFVLTTRNNNQCMVRASISANLTL